MAVASGRVPRLERNVRSDGTAIGIHVGGGMAAVVAALLVAGLVPVDAGGWRLVPIALVLVVVGVYTVDPAAMALVATLAYLLVIGFLVNGLGVLSWHGTPDVGRILTIAASWGVGLGTGVFRQWWRHLRPLTVPDEWLSPRHAAVRNSTSTHREGVTGG